MKGIEMPRCILLHDHDHDEGDCVYEPMTPTDPLEAAWEALGRDVANHKLTGTGIIAKHRPLIEAATPRPAGELHDPRNVDGCPLCPCTEPGK